MGNEFEYTLNHQRRKRESGRGRKEERQKNQTRSRVQNIKMFELTNEIGFIYQISKDLSE